MQNFSSQPRIHREDGTSVSAQRPRFSRRIRQFLGNRPILVHFAGKIVVHQIAEKYRR